MPDRAARPGDALAPEPGITPEMLRAVEYVLADYDPEESGLGATALRIIRAVLQEMPAPQA
jgi:hypothetical protein